MIKSLSCILFCISILLTQKALADIPEMNLSWTLSGSPEISQYKLYYSSISDMSTKTWHSGCGQPSEEPSGTFSMSCTNIPINYFPAYIQVVGQLTDASEIPSNIQKIAEDPSSVAIPLAIPVVQDFKLLTTAGPTASGTVFYWSLNSLPITTTTSDIGNVTIAKHQNAGTSASGVIGNCFEQTGTSQSYYFPMTIVPTQKGTVSFWAKHNYPPDSTDSATRFFFNSTEKGQANTIYAYTYKNSIYFYIYDSSGSYHRTYKVADTWKTGVWYKYEFIWNGEAGSMSIRRDGAIVSEISTSPWSADSPSWGTQDFFIGNFAPLGSFDEFYISNN